MKSKIWNVIFSVLLGLSIVGSAVGIVLSVMKEDPGPDGMSAYETWLESGYEGTEEDFLNWLKGEKGTDGNNGKDGVSGQDGEDGKDGAAGKSAFDIWKDLYGEGWKSEHEGKEPDEADFLDWLKGEKGEAGKDGTACDHTYSNGWEIEVDATCTSIGYKVHTCDICGEKDYEFIDKTEQHSWDNSLVVIPPCEQDGITLYSCTICGTTRAETTSKEGHHYESGICTACGKEEDPDYIIYTTDPTTFSYVVNGLKEGYPSEIRIPSVHNGFPVSIGEKALVDCTNLVSVIIADGISSIGNYAFHRCTSLKSVTIPDSVISIGNSAFYGCVALAGITVPDSVTTIGNSVFNGCTGLTSVTVPGTVTTFGNNIFSGCTGLKSVELENGVPTIDTYTFYNCTALASIIIPDSVTSIGGGAFYNCTALTSIVIPDSVTAIDAGAFYGCSGLESIQIPFVGVGRGKPPKEYYGNLFGAIFGTSSYSGGTEVKQSASYTGIGFDFVKFYIPSSLTSVTVTGGSVSYGAFQNCTMLTDVALGEGITSIAESAFSGCRGLNNITIPLSLTRVYDNAFYASGGLKTVYYMGTEEDWKKINISTVYNSALTSAARYYYSDEPIYDDAHWHYDNEGNIVIWEKET